MDVCYSGFLFSTLRTFNLSLYSLKRCITLHKNSGGTGAKTGGLEPLSPIASAATGVGGTTTQAETSAERRERRVLSDMRRQSSAK